MIQQLATEAAGLVRKKQFATLPNAVECVLNRYDIQQDRGALFRQVLSELGKRGARTKGVRAEQEKIATTERETAIAQASKEQMLRDARAHELRQPRSAWDPNDPENAP